MDKEGLALSRAQEVINQACCLVFLQHYRYSNWGHLLLLTNAHEVTEVLEEIKATVLHDEEQ